MSAPLSTSQHQVARFVCVVTRPRTPVTIDFLVGVLLPFVCLIIDPFVFRSEASTPIAPFLRTFAYLSIPIGWLLFTLWLTIRTLPCTLVALLIGVFAAGGVIAGSIGLIILPLTLLGLLVVIGVIGFFPFATSFIFFRAMLRAYRGVRPHRSVPQILLLAALGFALSIMPGAWLQWSILTMYPDYNEIPSYPNARTIASSDWYLINSGENRERTLVIATADPPDMVATYYTQLLTRRHWHDTRPCERSPLCLAYESATDRTYWLDLPQTQLRDGSYEITLRLQE
jgi:hypothetical protein